MIADHQGETAGKLPHLVTIKKIDQAMLVMRNKDRDRGLLLVHRQLPGKSILRRQRGKNPGKCLRVQIEPAQGPLDAHEKQPLHRILMLVGVQDIPAMLKNKPGNGNN
jgi:hypothetical protein